MLIVIAMIDIENLIISLKKTMTVLYKLKNYIEN